MKIQTTKIFSIVDNAINQFDIVDGQKKRKYTTISAQGSSRSSKTYNILIRLITYLLQNPGLRLSIVRKTLPALKATVFVDFKEIMRNMGIYDERGCMNKTDFIYTFPNGSWIDFFSTDDEQKIRGRKRDILFVNEANEISFIEWQQLKMRTTKFAIIDYNPSFSDDHWLCEINRDPRTYHFITTYKDNPFLEQTIIDEIESLQYKNESLWRVYGLGLQCQVEGLVFPKYTLVDSIPYYCKKRGYANDFGYTHDPTAIVDVGLLDNKLYIDEICYKTHMLAGDIIEEFKGVPKMRVISESADPRLIQEIYNAGINIYPVEKFKGSVMAGIQKMQEYEICITRRSSNVIKEFNNYTYLQDKAGKWLNEPIDKFNHAIDAVRYWVLAEILGHIYDRKVFYDKDEFDIDIL